MCLPLMRSGSSLLCLLSSGTFAFAIGIFVFIVQLRLLAGLFCMHDRFSYDKPDLFFKGRDIHGMLEGSPISAYPPIATTHDNEVPMVRGDDAPPIHAIKAANC